MSEHLFFVDDLSKSNKTIVSEVKSKNDGAHLGIIKWKSQWRTYCFFPDIDWETFWSVECLQELTNYMNELNFNRLKLAEGKSEKELYENGKPEDYT